MTKGLPRSMRRGSPLAQEIVKATIPFSGSITVAGTTGVGFGSMVIGDFPEGNVLLLGAVAYATFTGPTHASLGDTWNGDYGIGTTPAGDGTLSAADIDIIDTTPVGPAVAEVSPRTRGVSVAAAGPVIVDNTDGSLEMNLSLLVDDADIGASVAIAAAGELHLAYIVLGDD